MFDYINYMCTAYVPLHITTRFFVLITLILLLCQNTEVVICFNIIDNLKTGSWSKISLLCFKLILWH